MANLDDMFPSKYLKESDLRGQPVTVTISDIVNETVGDDHRMVCYFRGKKKGLVLNKTNAYKIGDTYGRDTDQWLGNAIELYPSETDYQGKTVPCIRVRAPQQQQRSVEPPPPPRTREMERHPDDMDDEIPF